ncbi:MAG TPA: zinc ribbon-containing protein [Thiohalobacter sp.]|nr:zinc ribbon-containing protein [Thiohalobacter sp.]
MSDSQSSGPGEKLVQAYHRMMDRVQAAIDEAEEHAIPTLEQNLERAKERAIELGELTREEAERVAAYLKRDMEDAASYLEQTGNEFGAWLRFDIGQIERRLFEKMLTVADRTRIELAEFEARMHEAQTYHTGEVTGPGVLRCESCGEELHFSAPGHIPPCPKCHATRFVRAKQ